MKLKQQTFHIQGLAPHPICGLRLVPQLWGGNNCCEALRSGEASGAGCADVGLVTRRSLAGWLITHYIYIYPRGRGFPGGEGVGWDGVGWGGVGCSNVHVTCVDVDATLMLRCCYGDATVMLCGGVGWGGVGRNNVHVTCNNVHVTKSELRRHGLQKVVNDPIEHRNVLAVHYLNKKPGLESVVKALARFRRLAMKSCRQPTLVFKEAPWDSWNRKNSWLTALGNFDDMQKHWEFPMKNNITSKYLWKHSTLYPFPLIFDISLNVHLVSPMGKKEHKNRHVTMVHLRIQLRRTIFLKDIKYEMNYIKHLHFTAVKHCFFSNSMSLSDVLSENLLPLPYIYCIYIYGWWFQTFLFSISYMG